MRARNIKPGFYKNEELVECSFAARLLFPGLWMMADRKGRMEDRPKRIKMEVFPADNIDVADLLDELENHGLISRYEVDGKGYILVPTMVIHQRFHTNETPSVLPPHPTLENDQDEQQEKPRKKQSKTSRKSTCRHGDNHSALNAECLNAECLNAELIPTESCPEPPTASGLPVPSSPTVISIPLKGKTAGEYHVTEADVAEWEQAYPAVDIRQTLASIRQWNLSNPTKQKTARGIRTHITGWLDREQNRGGNRRAAPQGGQGQEQIMPRTYAQAQDMEERQMARMLIAKREARNGLDSNGARKPSPARLSLLAEA